MPHPVYDEAFQKAYRKLFSDRGLGVPPVPEEALSMPIVNGDPDLDTTDPRWALNDYMEGEDLLDPATWADQEEVKPQPVKTSVTIRGLLAGVKHLVKRKPHPRHRQPMQRFDRSVQL